MGEAIEDAGKEIQGKSYIEKIEDAACDAANYISETAKSAMDTITGKTNGEKV